MNPNLELAPPHTSWSLGQILASADIITLLVIIMLCTASIWSWAIIINNAFIYRKTRSRILSFESHFWSGQLLDTLYEHTKRAIDNPLAAIFVAAMNEFKRPENKKINQGDASLSEGLKDRITQAMSLVRQRELGQLEKYLTILATIGSTTPFIGLFGMVWGVMNSFQAINAMQNVSLATVAPGIAEALFVTAIGLFAAIPAVIAYNLLISKVDDISNKIDDFILELYTILARAIDEGKI